MPKDICSSAVRGVTFRVAMTTHVLKAGLGFSMPNETLTARTRLLRAVSVLESLDDAQLADLETRLTWRQETAGQQIVRHLEPSSSFFLVLKGKVRIRIVSANGREVAFRMVGAGGHFGEIAALAQAPRTATVDAATNVVLGELAAGPFADLLARCPGVSLNLLQHMARNVAHLTDRVFELSTLDTRVRLCAEILRLSRNGAVSGETLVIAPAPTHEQIAALIGCQREGVGRELRALADAGIVRHRRGEIVILDPDRLHELVEREGGVSVTHLVEWSL